MNKLVLRGCLLSLALLSGCASQVQCDSTKTDPSMLEKLNCDVGGGYQRQVQQGEQNVLDARAQNELFRAVYADIDAQRKAVRQDLVGQQQDMAKLQSNLDNLLSQLKKKYAGKQDILQKITELERQAKSLQQSNSHDPDVISAKQQQLVELQRKISHLELSLGY